MDLCFKLYTLLYSAADRGAGRGLGLPGDGPQQQRGGARREGDAVCLPAAAAPPQELLLQAAVSQGLLGSVQCWKKICISFNMDELKSHTMISHKPKYDGGI